jgi:hypothetical protein
MYLRDLAASCLRRWYLAVLCLVGVAAMAMATASHVPATYEAKASVVLVPPRDPETPNANRYLSLGGLTQAVDVLTRSLSADETRRLVRAAEPTGTYEVVNDWATSAPMLVVTAKGESPAATRATLEAVLARVADNLRELQTTLNIGADSQITSLVVSRDAKPRKVTKAQVRAMVAVVGAGVVASALLIGAADGLLLRRSRRKLARREATETVEEPPEDMFAPEDELGALDRSWLQELEGRPEQTRPTSGAGGRPTGSDRA